MFVNIQPVDERYLPTKAHASDAAYDLRAMLTEPYELSPGETTKIPVGFKLGLEPGLKALVLPRSGLALKHGVTVLNSPGVIDAGYRGDVMVILHNTSDRPFFINDGDRIAQMSIEVVRNTTLRSVTGLGEATERGEGGFGSTGTN